jgi:hypothetical protein
MKAAMSVMFMAGLVTVALADKDDNLKKEKDALQGT